MHSGRKKVLCFCPMCKGDWVSTRLVPIMLQNLPIMLFGISPNFYLLCLFLCFLVKHYAFYHHHHFYKINKKLKVLMVSRDRRDRIVLQK